MLKKIKILRIIARLNIGGPAIHTLLLTCGLNNKFDSILVSGAVDDYEGNMVYLARDKEVSPIIIPELGRKLNFLKDLVAFYKIFQIIRKEQPDIIHTHTAKAGTLGRLAGLLYILTQCLRPKAHRLKLIHTFHGHVLHSYFGGVKTRFFIWIERFLARFTDKIIAVSNEVKNELLKLKIGDLKKVVVIPLGLDLDELLSLDTISNSRIRIGIIGRLTPIKNHTMFLKVVRKIVDFGLSFPVKFIIVGDGELRSTLEANSRELGLDRYIEFSGWQRNLRELYARLDIIVLTSLNEGTPVSLIEAMAASRPVVTTNVGGVKDLVNDQRGFLIESNDADTFAAALKTLIEDKQLRRRMGQAGREFVRDCFTKERLITDLKALYEELLKETMI